MKLAIRVEITTDWDETETFEIGRLERPYRQLEPEPFSSTPVLDWLHISMRVRYLEQIIKGIHAQTDTEKAARRVLISRVDRLRWCFWHARLEKAKDRMQGILLLCRVIVPETPGLVEKVWRNSTTALESLLNTSKRMAAQRSTTAHDTVVVNLSRPPRPSPQ